MGVSDSPLRDRVIFVEGAPRSGTTWLVNLLATHPAIAGVEAESHLFDFGADRLFDNFERRHPHLHGLQSYLDRQELVDLVRGLCDGVFTAMRAHVSPGTEPRFVVEKTPVGARRDGLELARKAETYPDAWYVHIVREREAVARSLMRAPWMEDRSFDACASAWDRVVGHIRGTLSGLPRYREVSYEALRADPAGACGELFAWLGVSGDDEVLGVVRCLSREPFSDLGLAKTAGSGSRRARIEAAPARLAARARFSLDRLRQRPEQGSADAHVAFTAARALRERDADGLRALTAASFELVYRSERGDQVLSGDSGRVELIRIAEETFGRRYVGEWWASAGGGPGEWWTSAPGRPVATVFFSALGGDATRVDIAMALVLDGASIQRAVVVSAGPLSGRPVLQAAGGAA